LSSDHALPKSTPTQLASPKPAISTEKKAFKFSGLFGIQFRGTLIELLIPFVIYGILLAVRIPYYPGDSTHSNEYQGMGMLFLWVISGFTFRAYWKAHNRKGWVGALVGVFVSTVFIYVGEAMHIRSKQEYQAARMVSEFKKDASNLAKSAGDDKALPKPMGQLDTTPKMQGDLGEEERFAKTFINNMASLRNDSLHELKAIGWYNLSDVERIGRDKNLAESKMIIQQAKSIINKYRANTQTLFENERKEIGTLNVSKDSKQKILAAFDSGMGKTRSQVDSIWDLEAESVAEFENIFTFLSKRKGAWKVRDGNLLFENDRDLKEFNSYLTRIQELATKEETIQKQSIEAANRAPN
jgi:hypothetical protein